MNTKNLFRFFAVLLLAAFVNLNTVAQDKAQLQDISNQMYNDGDISFILVQAYADNLLYEGQAYKFVYANGNITINEELLPAPYNKMYADRIKAFNNGKESYRSITGDGLVLADILNPKSGFRTAYLHEKKAQAKSEADDVAMQKILHEMEKDHLLDIDAGYSISYTKRALLVNNKKLEGRMLKKYTDLFRTERNFVPVKDGESISMSVAGK